jgi:hypothetical protein
MHSLAKTIHPSKTRASNPQQTPRERLLAIQKREHSVHLKEQAISKLETDFSTIPGSKDTYQLQHYALQKREDALKKRETALEVREAAVSGRQSALRQVPSDDEADDQASLEGEGRKGSLFSRIKKGLGMKDGTESEARGIDQDLYVDVKLEAEAQEREIQDDWQLRA